MKIWMVSFPNDILIQLMYKEVKNVKRQRVNLKSMCVWFFLSVVNYSF